MFTTNTASISSFLTKSYEHWMIYLTWMALLKKKCWNISLILCASSTLNNIFQHHWNLHRWNEWMHKQRNSILLRLLFTIIWNIDEHFLSRKHAWAQNYENWREFHVRCIIYCVISPLVVYASSFSEIHFNDFNRHAKYNCKLWFLRERKI